MSSAAPSRGFRLIDVNPQVNLPEDVRRSLLEFLELAQLVIAKSFDSLVEFDRCTLPTIQKKAEELGERLAGELEKFGGAATEYKDLATDLRKTSGNINSTLELLCTKVVFFSDSMLNMGLKVDATADEIIAASEQLKATAKEWEKAGTEAANAAKEGAATTQKIGQTADAAKQFIQVAGEVLVVGVGFHVVQGVWQMLFKEVDRENLKRERNDNAFQAVMHDLAKQAENAAGALNEHARNMQRDWNHHAENFANALKAHGDNIGKFFGGK